MDLLPENRHSNSARSLWMGGSELLQRRQLPGVDCHPSVGLRWSVQALEPRCLPGSALAPSLRSWVPLGSRKGLCASAFSSGK